MPELLASGEGECEYFDIGGASEDAQQRSPPACDTKSEDHYHIAVIGNTGVGKSQFLNALARDDLFETGDGLGSVTKATTTKLCNVSADGKEHYAMHLTDTPGMSGSEKQDIELKGQMLQSLRDQEYLHFLCIVLDSQHFRFDASLQDMMSCIDQEFGSDIWSFAALVLTHYKFKRVLDPDLQEEINTQSMYDLRVKWSNAIKERHPAIRDTLQGQHLPAFCVDSIALLQRDEDISQSLSSLDDEERAEGLKIQRQKDFSKRQMDKMRAMMSRRERRFITRKLGLPRILNWEPEAHPWLVDRALQVCAPKVENEPDSFSISIGAASSLASMGLEFDTKTGVLSGKPLWFDRCAITFRMTARNVAGESEAIEVQGTAIELRYPDEFIDDQRNTLASKLQSAMLSLPTSNKSAAGQRWASESEKIWSMHVKTVQHVDQREVLSDFFRQQNSMQWRAYENAFDIEEKVRQAKSQEEKLYHTGVLKDATPLEDAREWRSGCGRVMARFICGPESLRHKWGWDPRVLDR